MLHSKTRFGLIFLFLGLGIALHVKLGAGNAWFLYVAAIILLGTHFLFGNVWAAFSKLRRGKLAEAEAMINSISRPDWLYRRHRAYYHFTKGMIALQRKQLKLSEPELQAALSLGLRNNNDKALATLNLAHICFVEKRLPEAEGYLQQVKSLQPNDLMIKQNVQQLETALASS